MQIRSALIALLFTYSASLSATATPVTQTVVPDQFGGIFTRNDHVPPHPQPCRYPNPFTNACSCPAGFVQHQIWEWHTNCAGGYYSDGHSFSQCVVNQFQCTR